MAKGQSKKTDATLGAAVPPAVRLESPQFLVPPDFAVVVAFEVEGVKHYKPADDKQLPVDRLFWAMRCQEELDMKVTVDMQKAFLDAMAIAIKSGNWEQAGALLYAQRSLLENKTDLDIIYRFIAAITFTKDENPYKTDSATIDIKTEQFRRAEARGQINLGEFFTSEFAKSSLDFLQGLGNDLKEYSRQTRLQNKAYLSVLSEILSTDTTKTSTRDYIAREKDLVIGNLNSTS